MTRQRTKERNGKEKLMERTNRERLRTSGQRGLTRSSPLTRPEAKSF
jgi:hypothetical protein